MKSLKLPNLETLAQSLDNVRLKVYAWGRQTRVFHWSILKKSEE